MTPQMQTIMRYVIPVFTTGCMLGMPGSLQITFAFSSCLSLSQMYFLRQPWFRTFLGIQPLPTPAPPSDPSTPSYAGTVTRYQPPSATPPPAPEGVIGNTISEIKGAASKAMDSAKKLGTSVSGDAKSPTRRRTDAELKKASAYEEKRQRELAQEKAEARYARKERRRERRQAGG